MLTIGEFSNICKVSTKTLRYYAEIGLILPDEVNPDNGREETDSGCSANGTVSWR